MSFTELNLFTVFVASIFSFALGALWYSPLLFMKPWCKASGISTEDRPEKPALSYGLTFAGNILAAIALSFFINNDLNVLEAITYSLVISVAIISPSIGMNYLFQKNQLLHFIIDAGYHIARFAVMAAAINLLPSLHHIFA